MRQLIIGRNWGMTTQKIRTLLFALLILGGVGVVSGPATAATQKNTLELLQEKPRLFAINGRKS